MPITNNEPSPTAMDTVNTQTTSFFNRLTFRMAIGVCVFISLVMGVTYYVAQARGGVVISEQANQLNTKIGESIVLKLNERLSAAESLTIALANIGLILPKDESLYRRAIHNLLDNAGMNELIAGGGIWPEPNQFDINTERRSFFWGRNASGSLVFFDAYNHPEGKGYHQEEWYVPGRYMEKSQVYWSKSYMDPHSHEPMVTCMVPMKDDNGFYGVATIDLKLTGLSEFMAEQAKPTGGYALAVDRNNRLLSSPLLNQTYFTSSIDNNFPTIAELSTHNARFQSLSNTLSVIDAELLKKANLSGTKTLALLSKSLASDSYQIDDKESATIAAMILGGGSKSKADKHFLQDDDPVLGEAVSVHVFTMPNTNWKLVVAMPRKYTDEMVAEITKSMAWLLFVLLSCSTFIYGIFFKTAFLSPVNKLTSQVRSLVKNEDYTTKLNTHGQDELSQLAQWFNFRTNQLSDALNKLNAKNIALDNARRESDLANHTKNVFLASMSHDIRTPMNAIVGMSELLSKSELGSEQGNYARVINSSGQALLLLIDDIIDFSKIEANQLNINNIEFNLRETLDDCADLINFQASEKNLEFIYFMSPDINPNLLGDPHRIRQIILNLAGNALKFTASGRVELWVETTNQSDEIVNLHIDVRDTGVGLSASAEENLFKPFLQGDDSIARKFGGTGLGLTITKHLVELMGGTIDYRTVENIGTTFTFSIKLKAFKKIEQPSLESSTTSPNKKLLILGQNHFQNAVIERYAEASYYKSEICSTLQSWLNSIEVGDANNYISLCSDLGFFGDLERLQAVLPSSIDAHKLIVFKSQNETSLNKIKAMFPQLNVNSITLPLKFSVFLKRFDIENDLQKTLPKNQNSFFSPFNDKKVLVVEDNKVNQQVIMIMLRHLGLNADVVNDGLEAVNALEANYYDLILMDWQMPKMDGLEATRRIRALSFKKKPIIVAVTANAMSGDIDKCLEAGMDDYLSKPIRREKLASTIEKWLA